LGFVTLLQLITDFGTDQILFEALSAFGTVGLSTGITAQLPPEAKGIKMPIVEQVYLVMQGKMHPREIAPHLTHDTDEPQVE
jgi:Trk-type K+ transport system membrane component